MAKPPPLDIVMTPDQLNDWDYLHDLAERLMHIPVTFGTDQYDVDRLLEIARKLKD